MCDARVGLQVDLHLLDIKTGGEASPWITPDWVVDVNLETQERKQAGIAKLFDSSAIQWHTL